MNKKYFINVVGGTGLNFALASFITAVKEKYPDMYSFYVCSPYFDIFQCCESVDGIYKPNEIRDFIFDAKAMDAEIVNHRLYDMDGFIKKQMTYPMAWAKLCGIESQGMIVCAENADGDIAFLTPESDIEDGSMVF